MTEQFSVYYFEWVCVKCEVSPLRVKIGVSSNGELVASWRCPKCHKPIMATLPLEDVIAKVPPPPQKLLEAGMEELTKADISLLADMNISWG